MLYQNMDWEELILKKLLFINGLVDLTGGDGDRLVHVSMPFMLLKYTS